MGREGEEVLMWEMMREIWSRAGYFCFRTSLILGLGASVWRDLQMQVRPRVSRRDLVVYVCSISDRWLVIRLRNGKVLGIGFRVT